MGEILSQTDPGALGTGAGVVGTGLLGIVLAWIFLKLLPDHRAERREVREQFLEVINKHQTDIAEIKAALERLEERERGVPP